MSGFPCRNVVLDGDRGMSLGRPSRRWDPAHSLDVSREHHRQAQKTQVGRVTGGTGHQRNGGMREHRAAWHFANILNIELWPCRHGRRRRTKCRAACRSAMTGMRDRDVHKNIARRWFEAASGRGVMCGRPVHISTAIRRHGHAAVVLQAYTAAKNKASRGLMR